MADNQIEFDIVTNFDPVTDGIEKVKDETKKVGKEIGKNLGDDVEKTIEKAYKKIRNTVLVASAAITAAIYVSIKAASEEEQAINALNQSLANAGTYSEEASKGIQDFAAEIQRTTTIAGAAAIGLVALSRNFARSNEEAVKLTQAAIELSAATGVDLQSAVESLGKTLSGQAGRLAQQVPILRSFTEEQLKAGAALDAVISRFGGSAAAKVNTFSGAWTQLANTFGDLQTSIGNLFIKSPVVIALLTELSKQIVEFTKVVNEAGEGDKDPIGTLSKKLLDLATVVNDSLIGAFATAGRQLTALGQTFTATVDLINGSIASITGGGLPFKDLVDTYKTSLAEINKELNNPALSNAINDSIDRFKEAADKAKPILDDYKNNTEKAITEAVDPTKNPNIAISFANLKAAFNDTATSIKYTAFDLATSLKQSFVGGITNAFSAFGGALAKGDNAFAAFGKSILTSMGQLLIQFGSMMVAIGLSLSTVPFLFGLQGPAAVAAGLAAIVLGGALTALGGGGGGSSPAASTGSTSPGQGFASPINDESTAFQETEPSEPNTMVAVNIQGNVIGDKRTFGREIAEAINEAFASDGSIIARGAIA